MTYNNNFSNFNGNPYYTPTSFQILPIRHIITLTNLVCQIGLIRINITHAPNLITIVSKIISTLHRVNGDSPPPSPIFNQLVLLIHLVHNISQIHTQFHQFKIETINLENEYSWVRATITKFDGLTIYHKFQNKTSSFQVQSQQNDEPIDYEKLLEAMPQAQITPNHDIDIMVKTHHSHPLIIPNVANHSVEPKNHVVLENKIPFWHPHLNLPKL